MHLAALCIAATLLQPADAGLTLRDDGALIASAGKEAVVSVGLASWRDEWIYTTLSRATDRDWTGDDGARVLTMHLGEDAPGGGAQPSPVRAVVRYAQTPESVEVAYTFVKDGPSALRRGVLVTLTLPLDAMRGRSVWFEPARATRIPARATEVCEKLWLELPGGAYFTAAFDEPRQVSVEEAGGGSCTLRVSLTEADFPEGEPQAARVTYRIEKRAEPLPGAVRAGEGPLGIGSVQLSSREVPRYGLLELAVDLSAAYTNPFDPDEVALDALFTAPSGAETRVAGFYMVDHERSATETAETLRPISEGWRVRFAPTELGLHRFRLELRDRTGDVEYVSGPDETFECVASDSRGFVRASTIDPHYLAFDDGATYTPVGHNLPTYHTAGQTADEALRKMAAAGENYNRWWMYSAELGIEWEHAVGWYRQASAWRMDYALDLADELGLYYMCCMDTHQDFQGENAWDRWFQNPYNRALGGPCATAADWFTNPEAKAAYKKRLRYTVARWGHSPHVLAWEFGNEFEGWPGAPREGLLAWHVEMSEHLRSIDPYHHLITTSFWSGTGPEDFWALPSIDIVQTHFYLNSDDGMPPRVAAFCEHQWGRFRKPHIFGEFGIRSHSTTADKDPEGWALHNTFWSAVMSGCAGPPMPWWHEDYIDPLDLYHHFTAIRRFADGVDFAGERWEPVRSADLAYQDGSPMPRGDLVVRPAQRPFTRPEVSRFEVTPESAGEVAATVNGLLHGRGHPDLNNPPTFVVDYPTDGEFGLRVGRVSASGLLKVFVDGELALERDFPCGEGVGAESVYREQWDLWESMYNTEVTVPVAAGRHEIRVENTGRDWMDITAYRFAGLLPPGSDTLFIRGMRSDSTLTLWAWNPVSTWYNHANAIAVPPVAPTLLTLRDLPDGPCSVEYWDTWSGEVTSTAAQRVTAGTITIPLPEIASDVAVRVRFGA